MFIVIMGVSGSGKTTVGTLVAESLGWNFYDADSFHSKENVAKMGSGTALTDADRKPWLDSLLHLLNTVKEKNQNCVLACSSLKENFRRTLAAVSPADTHFVFLHAEKEVLYQRLEARTNHYMKANMLDSQLMALEPPRDAFCVDSSAAPEVIAREIVSHFRK